MEPASCGHNFSVQICHNYSSENFLVNDDYYGLFEKGKSV